MWNPKILDNSSLWQSPKDWTRIWGWICLFRTEHLILYIGVGGMTTPEPFHVLLNWQGSSWQHLPALVCSMKLFSEYGYTLQQLLTVSTLSDYSQSMVILGNTCQLLSALWDYSQSMVTYLKRSEQLSVTVAKNWGKTFVSLSQFKVLLCLVTL